MINVCLFKTGLAIDHKPNTSSFLLYSGKQLCMVHPEMSNWFEVDVIGRGKLGLHKL